MGGKEEPHESQNFVFIPSDPEHSTDSALMSMYYVCISLCVCVCVSGPGASGGSSSGSWQQIRKGLTRTDRD